MNHQYQIGLLAPLSPVVYARRPMPSLPYPLEEEGVALFARARQGLWNGLRALGLGEGDTVLVPAYHHGSEVEAMTRAGIAPRFYDVGPSLAPQPGELENLVDGSTRALHLTHSLGLPQDAPFWRKWCDERGLFLVEDAAQAWLGSIDGRPLGSWGDVSIFCLYKTVALPDGGALVARPPISPPSGRTPHGARLLLERHASWAMHRMTGWAGGSRARWGRTPYDPDDYDPAADFALYDPATPASRATKLLLRRVVRGDEAARRRRNYATLLEALREHVPEPLRQLHAGASPFVFPVASRSKMGLLLHLHVAGVDCLNLWAVPHPSLDRDRYPGAAKLRAEVVGLPVHHELTDNDLSRVVDEVRRGFDALEIG
jgi:perosamine synthetase